jgi:TATA-box binding protein (TBP) (component of TFIID and TFIIIB)
MKPFNPKEYKSDLLVLHLNKPNEILLVFPTGNKIEVSEILADENLKDGRKLLRLKSMDDFQTKNIAIKNIVVEWLNLIEK